ncbi:MAG: hypothetical protein CMJ27_13100 [Phycisphaerae bacterium]|nr:hypothetical protein [Phycisphaerae bacterium]
MTMSRSAIEERLHGTFQRVCVTGGAGFIGSHLVDGLRRAGVMVVVLDDLSTGRLENLAHHADGVELIKGSIEDATVREDAVAGCDLVMHLASRVSVAESLAEPVRYHRVVAEGTREMLESAVDAGVGRLVLAGSCSVYGDASPPIAETFGTAPGSPYAEAKLVAESHCRAFAASGRIATVCPRFFNVYGPRQRADSPYAGVIPIFTAREARREVPVIFGDGLQTRDFIHVEDVVRGLMLAAMATDTGAGEAVNFGTGRGTNLVELAGLLCSMPPRFEAARDGEVRHSFADAGLAAALLGFEAEIDLPTGLASLGHRRES